MAEFKLYPYPVLPPVLRVMIFVMACRIVAPAFSMSFLESADVMQIFNAGWAIHVLSRAAIACTYGFVFSLATRTPLVKH